MTYFLSLTIIELQGVIYKKKSYTFNYFLSMKTKERLKNYLLKFGGNDLKRSSN